MSFDGSSFPPAVRSVETQNSARRNAASNAEPRIKTENDGTANSVALEHTRVSGKARDIGFNHQYLTQYVKSLETDTVSMKLFSPAISEVVVFDAFRYQHLLMPLRF
jgi:DNA polymerase III sliding clamp (beta) subunit (PCNA family)